MKKAFIIGSSKGIGKSIKKKLSELKLDIFAPSSEELNTSNISMVKKYIRKIGAIDYLVLNTGGPPAKNFFSIPLVIKAPLRVCLFVYILTAV